ncbi:MAG: SDR family oxidoreductase [Chlamydiia bacterium]|nr:SDR family oxidoreductase [Chlamydiia bacterium]
MNIAIIGCGYIGSETAALWKNQGHFVTATTRRSERLNDLSKCAQKTAILKGDDPELLAPLIANHEAILVSIAADSPDQYESAYLHTAQTFRHLSLEMNMPRHLIYTSSTSVYGDQRGLWVDETSPLSDQDPQTAILIETEKTYLSLAELGWNICILRLAEIYGPGRELSKRVRGLQDQALSGSGERYTNMIHKTDCALAIDYALKHDLEGIFNLADDDHPTRKELYDQIAHQFHYRTPTWDHHLPVMHSSNKRVSNHKIKAAGFSLRYPHRVLE